eukprot:GFUD01029182.1.p1 GENE.GFUD01029182.1~~GFUD01029182.1.p1  ORF type:complete len:807 (-),score=69.72 GFUD01029182.1:150-2570(-)
MAELGHNYNIQCMKLFQELKTSFPSVPDEVVRQCMKQNRNDKGKCKEDLSKESQNYFVGRYKNRGKYAGSHPRRFSVDALSLSESNHCHYENSGGRYFKSRTNSFSESSPKIWSGLHERGVNTLSDMRPDSISCDSLATTNCDNTPSTGGDGLVKDPTDRVVKDVEHTNEIPEDQTSCSKVNTQNLKDSLKEVDDENNNRLICDTVNVPEVIKNVTVRKKTLPSPLSLSHVSDTLDFIPTVVLTPDSPPQDSPSGTRKVQTLYTPDESKVETTIIESGDLFFSGDSLEQEISRTICNNNASEEDSILICGKNNTVTKSFIDILPGIGPISLPFGNSSILGLASSAEEQCCSVTKSTTSLTQGTVHFLKDAGNGTISIATTTFCGVQKSVFSSATSGEKNDKPSSKSTTVLYSVNRKPIICENPFRKVFAKRKQFYQAKEGRDQLSPETSSKKLIWRHSNHNCNRLSPDPSLENIPPKYFTLNANIKPFDPFIIKHDISSRQENPSASNPWCSSVNLTLCPQSSSSNTAPVEMLPDGTGLKYLSRVEIPEDGSEACLEVKVNLDGSTITTKRTGKSDCTSNEISVQLMDGGNQVNIQQSQISQPAEKPVRPSSLHIPGSKYSTSRHAQSMYQGRGSSPQSIPRYNSLPTLKGIIYDNYTNNANWDYQSHPKDEEKRVAYTRALLSHQMEQLLKLDKELRQERVDMYAMRSDVQQLENNLKRQEIRVQGHSAKVVHVEVKQLEHDIHSLRGLCDNMSKKVTNLTGGKVPLGETSINFENYLSQQSHAVPDTQDASSDMSSGLHNVDVN